MIAMTACMMVCGSIVLPDFEEWMMSVVFGSHSDMMARTRTGETESMVLNEMSEESALLYFVSVMGACVDPPCPTSTTVFRPRAIKESAKF